MKKHVFRWFLVFLFLFVSLYLLIFTNKKQKQHGVVNEESDELTEKGILRKLNNQHAPRVLFEPPEEVCCATKNYSLKIIETYSYDYWTDYKKMPRAITIKQHEKMMQLLELVDKIFRSNNLTYMLADGTLLGSYRHHDIIPWDDDLDILVKSVEREKILEAIDSLKSNVKLVDVFDYMKIYLEDGEHHSNKTWTWPYVDMYFYTENETHIEPISYTYQVPIEAIYPLRWRPFGRLFLPTPQKPQVFLTESKLTDTETVCIKGDYNHMKESEQSLLILNCKNLHNFYPFVKRTCNRTHCIEDLLMNKILIQKFIYKKII